GVQRNPRSVKSGLQISTASCRGRPVTRQATFRARPGQKTSHGWSASPSLIPSLQRPARKRAPFLVDGPIVSAAGY
ncbi:hypothetical protein M9458_047024, partial [Cirrhinus mrigala]